MNVQGWLKRQASETNQSISKWPDWMQRLNEEDKKAMRASTVRKKTDKPQASTRVQPQKKYVK